MEASNQFETSQQFGLSQLRGSHGSSDQLDAVIIRNLTYEAGRGRNKKLILNKINLTVPEGSIYGLLGPSGCGKTTMLRCVVGRIRPNSGSILVFGLEPGDSRGEVPGRDIGYMPQEISIYEDFTIEETLRYFGKINRMETSEIQKRIDFLLQFLDLPNRSRLVVNLRRTVECIFMILMTTNHTYITTIQNIHYPSGGQKRRVSLAAALVHSPPLLILDEPTVGVDPLLRQSIWQHLVTLTKTERISVIITTHYIEEARQANVVGLMRYGKILAENSPDDLMRAHELSNLEDVFLKLCVTDSARRAASMATGQEHQQAQTSTNIKAIRSVSDFSRPTSTSYGERTRKDYSHRWDSIKRKQLGSSVKNRRNDKRKRSEEVAVVSISDTSSDENMNQNTKIKARAQMNQAQISSYTNDTLELSSSSDNETVSSIYGATRERKTNNKSEPSSARAQTSERVDRNFGSSTNEYLTIQAVQWAARRSNELNMINFRLNNRAFVDGSQQPRGFRDTRSKRNPLGLTSTQTIDSNFNYGHLDRRQRYSSKSGGACAQWWQTLIAVTWKNYIRLRRNPPVLVFQFMLPAIQVILFCLCIGGEPFDVPVAVVNEESTPRSSLQFLGGLNKKVIRQVKYDNLTSAIDAVKRGKVWGAIHIPDKYSQNLQTRLIMGEDVTNETISNGTIRVYPDLTNLHLALALETTFRETFINFARNSLEELGYDRSLADLPIQIGKPVYGTLKKDSYLEFMAPGVVISISYVMATGLTALAFILERRDGLLERSLVSGVGTSQILLAHAVNQVVVMVIQIFMVLGCTFFVFEIPSRGPFAWVVLLILLQGCTGMGFGLLVSAICTEENTAVMMVVGTFYTNLILAGIIWPVEAMPHWLRPVSYAQPQTLPTDTLRNILSRGWGITEPDVLLGFGITLGWLVIFLMAAGLIFKYSG